MKAELVPDNGDPPIPITRDVTVVGRREFCDVQVNDPSLSKRHCVVVKTDGLLVIRDLATTNGTKVKGQRIRWAALLPDDRITLGNYKMRVYLGPDDAPGPSELAQYQVAGRGGPAPRPAPAKRAPAKAKRAVAARVKRDDEAAVATSTPVETPAAALVGEDDLNWQRLELLDDDDADVIIELD
jgi:predicted component of type VI protein secretion system